MPRSAIRVILILATVLTAGSAIAAADAYVVIVNDSNKTSSIPRHVVAAMFMKKVPAWPSGTVCIPVDQPGTSAVRESFSNAIHRKPASAIRSYWQQQIFSGRDVPPLEKNGDAEVIAFVRNNPGAIGYIAPVTPLEGVKAIKVTE